MSDAERAKYSMSARDRWATCPASVAASEGKADEDSVYAIDGTLKHQLFAHMLKDRFAWAIGGNVSTYKGIPTIKQLTLARQAVDDLVAIFPHDVRLHTLWLEQRVEAPTIVGEDVGGTLDVAAWFPQAGLFVVADAKFGARPVDVGSRKHPNRQIEGYAILALQSLMRRVVVGINTVRLAIIAPSAFAGGKIKYVDLPFASFEARARQLRHEADRARIAHISHTVPGRHCGYCPGRLSCHSHELTQLRASEFQRLGTLYEFEVLLHDYTVLTQMYKAAELKREPTLEFYRDALAELFLTDANYSRDPRLRVVQLKQRKRIDIYSQDELLRMSEQREDASEQLKLMCSKLFQAA